MGNVVWEIKSPKPLPPKTGREGPNPALNSKNGSNPGVAVSLSFIFSGLGQFYHGQFKLGFLYFFLMLNVHVLNASILINWRAIEASIQSIAFTYLHFTVLYGTLLILGAVVWAAAIVQAYLKAVRSRKAPYTGTTHRILPAFLSLLVPGWGQFLNGQVKKGVFFLAVTALTAMGGVAVLFVILVWESVESAAERLFWERILTASLLPLTIAPLLWTICFYDALVVGLDEVKKEPLWNRIQYANNRRRIKGWKTAVVYPVFITIVLSGFLGLAGAAGYQYIEKGFYLNMLESAKVSLEQKKMVILPEWIARAQSTLASM